MAHLMMQSLHLQWSRESSRRLRLFVHAAGYCALSCGALAWGDVASAQTSGLVVNIESCTAYETLGGDTEMTVAKIQNTEVGLVAYVRDTSQVCARNNVRMQQILVRPLDSHTGVPQPASSAVLVGTDECGIIQFSDGEWGSTETDQPLLAYTAASGVRVVEIRPKKGGGITFTNQMIPGSDNWMIAGLPLSWGFTPVQMKSLNLVGALGDSYEVAWSRITSAADGTIQGVELIHLFAAGDTDIRSQLHPTDPDKFIRVSLNNNNPGVYEYSATAGADIALIHDQGPEDTVRAWMMPSTECAELGLDDTPPGCPAIAMGVRNRNGPGGTLLWKAKARDGTWREVVSVPYSEHVRVAPAIITHLDPPRSAVLATGEGDARLYLADRTVHTILEGGVRTQASEALYFPTSQLLGLYVEEAETRIPTVCMVKFQM
jgi:hypothetical protein